MRIIKGIHNIAELFQLVVIKSSLKSIRSVFQLDIKLKYDPDYQRNYVWPYTKGTYFIETILLHGEVPPIVVYMNGNNWEIIDGRQRCETIIRYLEDDFELKANGLDKLWNLAGKKFSQLDQKLKDRIQKAVLRFILIEAKDKDRINATKEDAIKREIFKRYNMGISPPRKDEVSKAQYLHDVVNVYFNEIFDRDIALYNKFKQIFIQRLNSRERMMQQLRQLLVVHEIPVNKLVNEGEFIVNRYSEYSSYNLAGKGNVEKELELLLYSFRKKLNFIAEIKELIDKELGKSGRLIYECLYWALSICEKENIVFDEINNNVFKGKLLKYLLKNIGEYSGKQSNFSQNIKKRYAVTASFFTSVLNISFTDYLQSSEDFKQIHKEKMNRYMKEQFVPELEEVRFSKVNPTSSSIVDILDKIQQGKFEIRPPYQRLEVVDYAIASSLIESILLGLKLNPIYVYLREDGVTEVIDGQQRLLVILGFLAEKYKDETGKLVASRKNGFSLKLKDGILREYNGKKFKNLPVACQETIKSFDLDIIEIRESDNKDFKPEELFKRLNHKPFPIDEHSFEYWNSYVDNEIVGSIKDICKRNSWLYLKKTDKRMENEELVTSLCYLNFMMNAEEPSMEKIKDVLGISRAGYHLSVWVAKGKITTLLEEPAFKKEFLLAINHFEMDFIEKIKLLISSPGKIADISFNKRLDAIMYSEGMRSARSFYVLWLVLAGLSTEYVREEKTALLNKINRVFAILKTSDSPAELQAAIVDIWEASKMGIVV